MNFHGHDNEAFFNSIKPGDIIAARVQTSTKLHLIKVVRPVVGKMLRSGRDEDARGLLDGRVLCLLNPRYFWRPVEDLEQTPPSERCPHCFRTWRSQGRPAIKGWKRPEEVAADGDVRLSFGWQKVSPGGHPLDLPTEALDPDPEEDENKVGAKRVEVRRWQRGARYVRIVRYLVDTERRKAGSFGLRYGALEDEEDAERWWLIGSWSKVLPAAVTLMALGGTRSDRTKADALGMKDVARSYVDPLRAALQAMSEDDNKETR